MDKKSIIMAMAAITGCAIRPTNAAAKAALADMCDEMGKECVYTIEEDPFIGVFDIDY